MPLPKKDSGDSRSGANSGRVQNGNRAGFRTDGAISSSRAVNERVLKPWMPDGAVGGGESLETATGGGRWDQFAANEEIFGVKTDYDENIYTTAIDKSHPEYKERMATADKIAREIERSAPTTSHVAEERVMDFVGGRDKGGDEEEKYSGVRRQDFPPLGGRDNKYTPPAKRAPSSQTTVVGAPVDPAIISSQLKGPSSRKSPAGKPDDNNNKATASSSKSTTPKPEAAAKVPETKTESKAGAEKPAESKTTDGKDARPTASKDAKAPEKAATPLRPAAGGRSQAGEGAPSATSTVERDVLNSFKNFAAVQRSNAEKARIGKAKADKEVKLTELKKFADTFKLSTPVPSDLIGIIAKDPVKQKEIQAKAMQNAEDVLKSKESATKGKEAPSKESQSKQQPAATEAMGTSGTPGTPGTSGPPDTKPAPRPQASHAATHSTLPSRHGGARQSYGPSSYNTQTFRNDRGGHGQQPRTTGQLSQRLREQHKPSSVVHAPMAVEPRLPPTGPANNVDSSYNRRLSGVPGHINKLNPNTQEFRPNPFATSFNPGGHPSAGSSPRSAANQPADVPAPVPAPAQPSASPAVQAVRRKTKAVDKGKCDILSHIKTIKAPQEKKWEDNGGLRPTYDTQPTWRQLQEDVEKPESTMQLTYKQHLERNPFGGAPGSLSTPNPTHVAPQLAHQHQLPFHLQQGAHGMGPRQSPHMAPMQMHTPHQSHQSHSPHVGYNADDHRMMPSNSAQSFASPRMSQAPAVYSAAMNSPAQAPYSQPVMQPYISSAAPSMGPYRSASNNAQYMAQQPGQMGAHIMMQPYISGPQGMVATHPQFANYAVNQGHFMPPGVTGPPQPMAGSNGYPSPGRPAAPMMAHQGSQQGQPVFGMSPSMGYQQPVFVAQQPGQMNNARGYASPAAQHYGSGPQPMHQYGQQHRSGSNNYGNKNFSPHGQHQVPQPNHSMASVPQSRAPDGPEEAK